MKKLKRALELVEETMSALHNIWDEDGNDEILNNDKYPFEKSFDEMHLDFHDFRLECVRLIEIEEEKRKIPFTYAYLKRKICWEDLHKLIGVGFYALKEGFEIQDSEVFQIKESDAKTYDLI